MTWTSMHAFYINGDWCSLLLLQLSREKTNYMIKQLLTIEVLAMTLIPSNEYQYWPRLSPQSVMVFSGGYYVISNTSIVNNCIAVLFDYLIYCKHRTAMVRLHMQTTGLEKLKIANQSSHFWLHSQSLLSYFRSHLRSLLGREFGIP